MTYRSIDLNLESEEVRRFFLGLGDDGVVVEANGRPVCVISPCARLGCVPAAQLREAAGGWDLPADILRAISGESEQ
jgi:hypothetical protein